MRQNSDRLPRSFEVLEELTKHGKHAVVDKLVYLDKFPGGDKDAFAFVSEVDIDLDRWIELHIRLRGERKTHYAAVIRPARNGRHIGWKSYRDLGCCAVERNPSMFVDVPEPMQLPQFCELISIPVVVWLKSFDDFDGISGDSRDAFLEQFQSIAAISRYDREASLMVGSSERCLGEGASQMIQGCPQAGNGVARSQTDLDWNRFRFEMQDVLSSIKIILGPRRVCLALQKFANLDIESFQVFLRPCQFQAGIEVGEVFRVDSAVTTCQAIA